MMDQFVSASSAMNSTRRRMRPRERHSFVSHDKAPNFDQLDSAGRTAHLSSMIVARIADAQARRQSVHLNAVIREGRKYSPHKAWKSRHFFRFGMFHMFLIVDLS